MAQGDQGAEGKDRGYPAGWRFGEKVRAAGHRKAAGKIWMIFFFLISIFIYLTNKERQQSGGAAGRGEKEAGSLWTRKRDGGFHSRTLGS